MQFTVPLVIYPLDVIVSIGESRDQVVKTMKKYGIDYDDKEYEKNTCRARCESYAEGYHTLIRLKKVPETPLEWGQLQHEVFHAVTYILSWMGVRLVIGKTDEAYAYLFQYLTTEIYKKL